MKQIIKYAADDGAEFSDETKCREYEALCAEIQGILDTLPKLPENDGCCFTNGSGYIQHDRIAFLAAREALLKIAQRFTDHHWLQESIDKADADPSYAARIISECCPSVLGRAFYRVQCTSAVSFREYGQLYYVANPDKVEGGQINL